MEVLWEPDGMRYYTSGGTFNPPGMLYARAGNTQCDLYWDVPVTGTPSGYRIYRSLTENGTYTAIDYVISTSTVVTGLTNGYTYWFYVTAVYTTVESIPSNKRSVTTSDIPTLGGTISASISTAGESDWYKFQTSVGGPWYYIVQTHGSLDTYMDLYDSDQTTWLESDDDDGEG